MTLSHTSARALAHPIGAASGLVDIEGNTIYYDIAGAGLPIVFVHDGLLHRVGFDHQFEAFAKNFTVIRYDRPGYGDSHPPQVSYSHVGTLKKLLDLLSLESIILIGGSAGGRIAIDFAIAHPDRAGALVLVGAVVSGLDSTDHMWYRGWRNEWGETMADHLEFWANDPWLIAEENQAARARFRQVLTAAPQNLENFPVPMLDQFQSVRRLSEIQAPTLLVIGESDIADNHAHSGVIQVGIAGAEREVVTRSGHLVYFEQPEKFNRLVLDFLARRVNAQPA